MLRGQLAEGKLKHSETDILRRLEMSRVLNVRQGGLKSAGARARSPSTAQSPTAEADAPAVKLRCFPSTPSGVRGT